MESKNYIEEQKCDINGFNRDNESKMRKCGDLFLKETGINDIGCGPHVMHVILKGFFAANSKCSNAKEKSGKILTHLKKSKSKHFLKQQTG